MLATRGGSRTPRLYHNSDRSVGSADCTGLHNPRFEPRSRLEEGAGRSTLTLNKVRAVLELRHVEVEPRPGERPEGSRTLELRHVEVELSFEQRPRGCGPSSNYDTRRVGWAD